MSDNSLGNPLEYLAFLHISVKIYQHLAIPVLVVLVMQLLGKLVDLFHGFTEIVILLIIGMTIIMSFFLYKILFQQGYFSNYNRNL